MNNKEFTIEKNDNDGEDEDDNMPKWTKKILQTKP